jgi:hypothetical protein
MPDEKQQDRCITPEELVEYIDHHLVEDREIRLEEHIAECEHCGNIAREFYTLSARWERWTARTHADACSMEAGALRALLERALDKIGDAIRPEDVGRWKRGAEGAVRVVIREIASLSEIMTEGLEDLLRPQAAWRFVPAALSPRGAGTHEGGVLIVIQVETSEVGPSGKRARIGMDPASGKIMVSVENHPEGRPYPRVLLIPLQEKGKPELGEWKSSQVPGSKVVSLYAQFSGRKPGEYFIAFEPIEE